MMSGECRMINEEQFVLQALFCTPHFCMSSVRCGVLCGPCPLFKNEVQHNRVVI